MAKLDKKPRTPSRLLSCFGISEVRDEPIGTDQPNNTDKKKKKKKNKSCLCLPLPRAFVNQKSGAKTVPFDAGPTPINDITVDIESEKAEAKRRFDNESRSTSIKSKSKVRRSKSSDKLSGSRGRSEAVGVVPEVSDQDNSQGIRSDEAASEQNPLLESRSDHREPEEPCDTCQPQRGLSFSQRTEVMTAGGSGSGQPGSPALRTRSGPMTRSSSFPAPPAKKPNHQNDGVSRNFDSLLGMSIVMVMLIMMALWGRLCAILCTSAWLYFIHQIRSTGRSDGHESADPDPDPVGLHIGSEEYKKKVVLEGLLERERRRSPLREKGVS